MNCPPSFKGVRRQMYVRRSVISVAYLVPSLHQISSVSSPQPVADSHAIKYSDLITRALNLGCVWLSTSASIDAHHLSAMASGDSTEITGVLLPTSRNSCNKYSLIAGDFRTRNIDIKQLAGSFVGKKLKGDLSPNQVYPSQQPTEILQGTFLLPHLPSTGQFPGLRCL